MQRCCSFQIVRSKSHLCPTASSFSAAMFLKFLAKGKINHWGISKGYDICTFRIRITCWSEEGMIFRYLLMSHPMMLDSSAFVVGPESVNAAYSSWGLKTSKMSKQLYLVQDIAYMIYRNPKFSWFFLKSLRQYSVQKCRSYSINPWKRRVAYIQALEIDRLNAAK